MLGEEVTTERLANMSGREDAYPGAALLTCWCLCDNVIPFFSLLSGTYNVGDHKREVQRRLCSLMSDVK